MLKSFAGGGLFGGTWGSGTPNVLALHGWARSHRDFDPVFAPISTTGGGPVFGVVGPDLFGFGATPPPPEPWGTDQYARHLLPLFDEPGLLAERVVIVGHSYGGRVALRLHGLVPDRIAGMVLCGVPLLDRSDRRSRPPSSFRLIRRLHALGLISDARMEGARNRYGSTDYRQAQGVMRGVLVASLGERYADELPAIGCPVELVWGERDTEVPLEVAVRAQPLFPRAGLTVLPGVGHLVPTEAPQELLAAVVGSLEGRRDDPGHHDNRSAASPARSVAPVADDPRAGTP